MRYLFLLLSLSVLGGEIKYSTKNCFINTESGDGLFKTDYATSKSCQFSVCLMKLSCSSHPEVTVKKEFVCSSRQDGTCPSIDECINDQSIVMEEAPDVSPGRRSSERSTRGITR